MQVQRGGELLRRAAQYLVHHPDHVGPGERGPGLLQIARQHLLADLHAALGDLTGQRLLRDLLRVVLPPGSQQVGEFVPCRVRVLVALNAH